MAFFRANELDCMLLMRYVENHFCVVLAIYIIRESLKSYANVCYKGEGCRHQMLDDLTLDVVQSEPVVCDHFSSVLLVLG